MSRSTHGFLAIAVLIALALASVRVQLVEAGSIPAGPTELTSAPVATGDPAHAGH